MTAEQKGPPRVAVRAGLTIVMLVLSNLFEHLHLYGHAFLLPHIVMCHSIWCLGVEEITASILLALALFPVLVRFARLWNGTPLVFAAAILVRVIDILRFLDGGVGQFGALQIWSAAAFGVPPVLAAIAASWWCDESQIGR